MSDAIFWTILGALFILAIPGRRGSPERGMRVTVIPPNEPVRQQWHQVIAPGS